MSGVTFERPFHVKRGKKGSVQLEVGKARAPLAPGRISHVSRLMALAIRFEGLIREGSVGDQAELARLGRVTRARLTQIMNLLNLAPDIQEAVLFLDRTIQGRDSITERHLRPIAARNDWAAQRKLWQALIAKQS